MIKNYKHAIYWICRIFAGQMITVLFMSLRIGV